MAKRGAVPSVAAMSRQPSLKLVPFVLLLFSHAALAEEAAPQGTEGGESGEEAYEPLPVGETIRVESGWIRVEPEDAEGGGTYSVVAALREDEAPTSRERVDSEGKPGRASEGGETPRSGERGEGIRCKGEKEAYLRQLFRIAGIQEIDVPYPLELLQALEQTPGVLVLAPTIRSVGGALVLGGGSGSVAGVDPIRALAWDDALRMAANELVRCHRGRD